MSGGGIRANPETRLPGRRPRRDFGVTRDIKLAWILAFRAIAKLPLLFLAVTTLWGITRYCCMEGLREAHIGLGGADTIADFDFWGRVGLTTDVILLGLGPLVLAGLLMPPVHRTILAARPPGFAAAAWRGARLSATLLRLALALAAAVMFCVGLPRLMLGSLGPTSTVLFLLLLLPLMITAALSILRWMIGLPGLSLGLPRSLAEGWIVTRGHITRSLAIFLAAGLPLTAAALAWLAFPPDPLGWLATIVHPVWDILSVALTASLTGLLYRAYRLPAAFRPDLRPSRNRSQRRDPVVL